MDLSLNYWFNLQDRGDGLQRGMQNARHVMAAQAAEKSKRIFLVLIFLSKVQIRHTRPPASVSERQIVVLIFRTYPVVTDKLSATLQVGSSIVLSLR